MAVADRVARAARRPHSSASGRPPRPTASELAALMVGRPRSPPPARRPRPGRPLLVLVRRLDRRQRRAGLSSRRPDARAPARSSASPACRATARRRWPASSPALRRPEPACYRLDTPVGCGAGWSPRPRSPRHRPHPRGPPRGGSIGDMSVDRERRRSSATAPPRVQPPRLPRLARRPAASPRRVIPTTTSAARRPTPASACSPAATCRSSSSAAPSRPTRASSSPTSRPAASTSARSPTSTAPARGPRARRRHPAHLGGSRRDLALADRSPSSSRPPLAALARRNATLTPRPVMAGQARAAMRLEPRPAPLAGSCLSPLAPSLATLASAALLAGCSPAPVPSPSSA